MTEIRLIEMADLEKAVISAIKKVEKEKQDQEGGQKLYTINQVRKRLGKAHGTIKKLTKLGFIKTTKDGLISESAINDYLQKA